VTPIATAWVTEFVVLVAELQHRCGKLRALVQTKTLCHRPGGAIADDHLQRHDRYAAADLVARTDTLHKVGVHAASGEIFEDQGGDLVVEFTLVCQTIELFTVVGGGVVLVVDADQLFVVGGEDLFCFSFVQK
jgi:hypothetical protein